MSQRTAALALRWWPFAAVAAIWLVVATQQITLPGVYMDAVNPDYLVVRVLNPHPKPITAWLLGSNDLFGKAPVLISLYHGSQQFWLGLPLFTVFGTTVTGLRLTHAIFALGVLAAVHAVLTRAGLKPWQAALACIALAADPAFSYAFRTQSYITLAPTAWLLLAVYSLQRATDAGRIHWWLAASGAFMGLATVGYFTYAFFLPAMLLALVLCGRGVPGPARGRWMRAALPAWLAGFLAGSIFYPIGYGLLIYSVGGISQAWSQLQQMQQALGAFSAQVPWPEGIGHVVRTTLAVFGNAFHHQLIFGEYAPLPGFMPKTWLLLAGPVALWAFAEARGRSSALLRTLIALPVSFVEIAMLFGTRLAGHHFMPLLPLAYSALAVALHTTARGLSLRSRWAGAGFALLLAGLVTLNVAGQVVEARRLAETRGVGLYSDAINRLSADLFAMETKPFVYFPDWGLSMPVAFLTRGTIGMDSVVNVPRARQLLCDGQDVAFAVISEDRAARIEGWRRELQWDAPATIEYQQGDRSVVFLLATFKGQRDAPSCAAPG